MHPDPPQRPQTLKTARQIVVMQENAGLLFELFASLKPFMVAGSTGIRIQEFCLAWFGRQGFRVLLHGYRDFPAQVCISRNEVVAHGIPDLTPLRDGDLVTVDVAGSRKGFCADAAWTYLVGGGEPAVEALRAAAWQACLAGARAGGEQRRKSAIGRVVQARAGERGCRVLPRFAGHGIGRFLHEAPHLVFLDARLPDDRLDDGLVLNIEPILARELPPAGSLPGADIPEAKLQPDGWAWALPHNWRSAQFEISLALLPDGGWRVLNFPDQALALASLPPF